MRNFSLLLLIVFHPVFLVAAGTPLPARITYLAGDKGISEMSWLYNGQQRNFIDHNATLGNLQLIYKVGKAAYNWKTSDGQVDVISNTSNAVQLGFQLPGGIRIQQTFTATKGTVSWTITVANETQQPITISDFSFPLPIGKLDEKIPARDNLCTHKLVNGQASFCYWIPYTGYGDILLMKPVGDTSLEYMTNANSDTSALYINAATVIEPQTRTWQVPGSISTVLPGKKLFKTFSFQMVRSLDEVRNVLYNEGSLDVRVAPGMVIPQDMTASFLVRSKAGIRNITAAYPQSTKIEFVGNRNNGYRMYKVTFKKLGENPLKVTYSRGYTAYLDFFSTEPLETLIKKRARFIVAQQQHKDRTKWYDGLYSIWDMEKKKLLSPDDKGPLPDFVVGGSDDPSNSKPFYVSEKNVAFPDKDEIASLEYYEQNFVWGKLQRRNDEYPYPYGIYGSENWYANRSGAAGNYHSGGLGKERMWRTFDYSTHLAIYFNLYKIARNNPELVHYLDAKGYLERAYRTAMAFFTVPYSIEMGKQWNFTGWCDWAYKQGNFHERYIVDILDALKSYGEIEKADLLRREWEKKVKYFIYDDPWPFGSEMFVDRTAFESSFYVAKYAKENPLTPQEKLWYDKNKKHWYSHTHIRDSAADTLLDKQLKSNLALRGVLEPEFNLLGSAWESFYGLDYMSQMAGVALLDYATQFSTEPARYINIGYSSLLSSWALMNTGDQQSGYGYWYPAKENDGAVGWVFTPWNHSTTFFSSIPADRGVWQYDGEIDHGLGGAVHGAASIVTRDSLFGLIGYGCELVTSTKDDIAFIPRDGVRQRINLLIDQLNLAVTLSSDGFAQDSALVCSNHFTDFRFTLENRLGNHHNCSLQFKGLLAGHYKVYKNGNLISEFTVAKNDQTSVVFIPMSSRYETISMLYGK